MAPRARTRTAVLAEDRLRAEALALATAAVRQARAVLCLELMPHRVSVSDTKPAARRARATKADSDS